MNRKLAWRLLGLAIGIAALAIVGVVAYNYGVSAGHGGTQAVFGPMRGYGRVGGFASGYGLLGLVPALIFGLLLVGLFAVLFSGFGRSTPASAQGVPEAGVDRLRELSEMHGRGELTDTEFTAAKQKLLGP
jgi:uncharacterized membrane protein